MGTVAVSGVGDWPHCSLWSDAVAAVTVGDVVRWYVHVQGCGMSSLWVHSALCTECQV